MKAILTVTKFTFIEVYRSKVLVSLLLIAMGLIVVTYVASEISYGAQAKVALDFGLGLMSLSNTTIAIFIGATLLNKEIEQKTLYMILSRPLSRASFLVGKTLGLSAILLMNSFFLLLMCVGMYLFLGGHYEALIGWSALFAFLEAVIVLLIAVYFSLITNTTMSVIYTIAIYVVGQAINTVGQNLFAKSSLIFSKIIEVSKVIVPRFYELNLKDFVLYRQDISLHYLFSVIAYALAYIGFMYFLISYVFNRKNLD
jgi:ABC-type transport system involved in multi-copper enzyme maturation permease subunit